MKELELNDDSRIDIYQEGWVIVQPSYVVVVERQQRIILRLRKSLLKGMSDDDCPGLDDEISKLRIPSTNLKRSANTTLVSPLKKTARISDFVDITQHRSPSIAPKPSPKTITAIASPAPLRPHPSVPQPKPEERQESIPPPVNQHLQYTPVRAIAGSPVPPQWPLDFYLCDVVDGLAQLPLLQTQKVPIRRGFSMVFDGAVYGKMTKSKYERFLNDPKYAAKRKKFIAYGRVAMASFQEFHRACTGKYVKRNGYSVSTNKPLPTKQAAVNVDVISVSSSDDYPSSSDESLKEGRESEAEEVDQLDSDTSSCSSVNLARRTVEILNNTDLGQSNSCRFCGGILPDAPSPKLLAMKEQFYSRTKRPSFIETASFCSRHRFEAELLPKAKASGWPSVIDFDKLVTRVHQFHDELNELVMDLEESEFFQRACAGRKPGRSDSGMSLFEEQGCGYYGELGFQIITKTLQGLFPRESLDLDMFKPLSWFELIEEVLLPETAVLLISQDMDILYEEAVVILKESRAYGVAMFPEDDDHPVYLKLCGKSCIKEEPLDIPVSKVGTGGASTVIDLTSDDY